MAAGGGFSQHAHHLATQSDEMLEVGAGDFHVDRTAGAEAAFKQARLFGHSKGAGEVGGDLADERDEAGSSERIECSEAKENTFSASDEEEITQDRVVEFLGFGTVRIHVPVGQQSFFYDIPHPQQFVEVVARRGQENPKHQVAIAFRQVFHLRQQDPGGPDGSGHNHAGRSHLADRAAQQKPQAAGELVEKEATQPASHVATAGGLGLASGEQPGHRGWHDQHRHNQREAHRRTDCQGDVAEELASFLFDKQHREKDGDRGECAGKHSPPDFIGPPHGG